MLGVLFYFEGKKRYLQKIKFNIGILEGGLMGIIAIIERIEEDVLTAKNEGNQWINADKLLGYLDEIKLSSEIQVEIQRDLARYAHERNMEYYKATTQVQLSNYETLSKKSEGMFQSVIDTGQAAIKSAVLINGGAAVALLAFVGGAWDKGMTQESLALLLASINSFALGALLGSIGSGLTYLTQLGYSMVYEKEMVAKLEGAEKTEVKRRKTVSSSKVKKPAIFVHLLTFVVVGAAFVMFYYGMNSAGAAFTSHFK